MNPAAPGTGGMKVSTKLYGAIASLALMGFAVGGAGVWYTRVLSDELKTAAESTAVKIDLVNAARARSWEMVAALRGALAATGDTDLEANAAQWNAALQRTRQQIGEIRPLLVSQASAEDLAGFERALNDFEKDAGDIVALCRQHRSQEIAGLLPALPAFSRRADEALTRLKNRQRTLIKESQRRSESLRMEIRALNAVVCLALVAAVLFSVLVVRRINTTILTVVGELREGSAQVAAAAGQVSSCSQALAQVASDQAASLEETSASSNQISSTAQRNNQHSHEAADLAHRSREQFAGASRLLDEMVGAIGEITAGSTRISGIIKAIDEIAFQTNILALNAAVEAARAGEAGMGFAVVADEVRNLAQRSAQAAKDTSALIEGSIAKSREGKERVDEVAATVRTIIEQSTQVGSTLEEVHTASAEQVKGIEQITTALTRMDQSTMATAAQAEEGASAAEELNAQSAFLKEVVERLTALFGGAEA